MAATSDVRVSLMKGMWRYELNTLKREKGVGVLISRPKRREDVEKRRDGLG